MCDALFGASTAQTRCLAREAWSGSLSMVACPHGIPYLDMSCEHSLARFVQSIFGVQLDHSPVAQKAPRKHHMPTSVAGDRRPEGACDTPV